MIVRRKRVKEFGFAAEIAAGLVSVVPTVLDMLGIKTPGQMAEEQRRQAEAAQMQAMIAQQQQGSNVPWIPIIAVGGGVAVLATLAIVLTRK